MPKLEHVYQARDFEIESSQRNLSDGPNTQCSVCHLIYVSVNEEALRNSITLKISGLTKEAFLEFNMFNRFLAAVSLLDPEWLPEDVRVFDVETSEDGNKKSTLNVSLFVVKDDHIVR